MNAYLSLVIQSECIHFMRMLINHWNIQQSKRIIHSGTQATHLPGIYVGISFFELTW